MPLAQRILSTTTLGLLLCTLAVFGMQPVQAAVQIDAASWDGAELTADGGADKPKRGGGLVEVFDADTTVKLGDANLANSGSWSYSGDTCADNIYATQDGVQSDTFPVAGSCGGGQNDPPVCVIDTPVAGNLTISEGDEVDYTGTATDGDGTIVSYEWTFDGGFPASSLVKDPGLVTYNTPGTYTTMFDATDNDGDSCSPADTRTITVLPVGGPPPTLPNQTEFKMMMNYELGMHCTGFEFAYCCVLPVYNSILAQVVRPQNGIDTPRLLEADPNENTAADVLARHTVVRDPTLDASGNFNKYVLRYWHDAQPRNDGRGKPQSTTLISAVEGNSLLSWNTVADSAHIVGSTGDCDRGAMLTGEYNGSTGVVLGDGDYTDEGCTFGVPIDNYQNVVWNHLYIYEVSARGVEGYKPNNLSLEADKHRLGLHVDYPENFGPAGHNMEGLLTFSGDHGTVVYTQMKVLEDLPITLTSPRIWEALGLPLTPFEDSIDFFGDPGLVDEDSIRPYVEMKARLHHANCDGAGSCTEGDAVLDDAGNEVVGFGTAPIDIPNCERCHSAFDTPNSPNTTGTPEAALVQQEIDFWNA
ncbi:MAG: PKD domain-containing protein, partial [Gammaproteobacteria bacterium]|nr:PKD domain-containing protein [Gammaproteobacteria bacterium]